MVAGGWCAGQSKLNRGFGVLNKKLGLGTDLPEFFDAVDEIGRENLTHEL